MLEKLEIKTSKLDAKQIFSPWGLLF